jgi:hypothetical protein
MNSDLQEALAGEPVTVTLGGKTYPLAYPIQGIILYKKETAALDRERKKAGGRASLTREEKRELRGQINQILIEADAQRPAKGESWNDKTLARFEELLGEAQAVRYSLDEDAATGDSLYDKSNWWKISPEGDPERMCLALWVGLHQFHATGIPGRPAVLAYVETLQRAQVGSLITLQNGEELTSSIAKTLHAHLIVAPESTGEEASPNVQPVPEPVTLPK